MIVIGVVAAVITTLVAVLIPWLPSSASEEMDRITFVYWFTTIICIAIFAVVMAVIGYSLMAFRASPDDESDGAHIHGHTGLEIVWTTIPAILVIAIGVVSAVVLSRNADAGTNPLTVKVFAQQFAWRFQYPDDGDVRTTELVLPVDRGVRFKLTAADVIHSFWVPEFGQKMDALPGVETEIVVTPNRTGEFTLICTELCGLGHATMRSPVRVLSQADFAAWLEEERTAAAPGPSGADGEALFASAGCGGCHAFTPAGTDAEIGPSLDGVAAAAAKAGKPVADYVKESIVDPGASLTEGYADGVMPTTFGESLREAEIDALVGYLTEAKG